MGFCLLWDFAETISSSTGINSQLFAIAILPDKSGPTPHTNHEQREKVLFTRNPVLSSRIEAFRLDSSLRSE
jgi:hypothetical protein